MDDSGYGQSDWGAAPGPGGSSVPGSGSSTHPTGEWEPDGNGMAVDGPAKESHAYFDATFSYAPVPLQPLAAYQPPPLPPPPASAPPPLAAALAGPSPLKSPVPAMTLLRNRLPILEAALATSAADPGNDEEEIWKAVEGAYEELKRVMLNRKEARRLSTSGKAPKRNFASMELESPTTPVDPPNRQHASATQFLTPQPPPLLHSLSSPADVPLSAHAQLARAQAQVQASQAQLQQAQLHAREADAHARARQAAEDDAVRVKHEAEAEAAAAADAHQREAEQQYQAQAHAQRQHALQLQQQELQFRQAQQHVAAAQQQQQQQHTFAQSPYATNPYTSAQYSPGVALTAGYAVPPPSLSLSTVAPGQISMLSSQMSPRPRSGSLAFNVAPHALSSAPPPLPQVPIGAPADGQFTTGYETGVPGDRSMGAVMQMHLTSATYGSGTVDPMDLSTAPLPHEGADGTRQRQNSGGGASFTNSATVSPQGTGAPALAPPPTQPPLASPPASGVPAQVLQARPSRSRAASGSGYVSASGTSRSRAASGSGYQSLLESRSRAASSASSVFGMYERDEEDELDDQEDHDDAPQKASSQMGAASAGVDPALRVALDPIFLAFLTELCSNLDATDSKGEAIHQTLMAKKMERLEQSQDFRPFKFRIQAFTSAFQERLAECGYGESEVPFKKIRQYLWAQPCISRFNDDGKKAKSKGNHIWSIEAKKDPDKKWIFREFTRCIKGTPPGVAFCGLPWSWAPRVWDPQCSVSAIGAVFSSPSLPAWLSWSDNVLSGEAPDSMSGQTIELQAIATFQVGGKVQQLEASTKLVIASVGEHDVDELHRYDEKPELDASADNSRVASPHPASNISIYPDPTQAPPQLLPSLMSNNPYETERPMKLEGADAAEQAALRLHQQQIQYMEQHNANANLEQVYHQQQMQETQAALHQRYSSSLANSFPLSDTPPSSSSSSLSYSPAPELVAHALQQAAFDREQNLQAYAVDDLSHAHNSEAGTPGMPSLDIDGRLAQFDLSRSQSYHRTM